MIRVLRRKAVVAFVAACAIVAVMAAPASAGTVAGEGEITAGIVTIQSSPPIEFEFGAGDPPDVDCVPDPDPVNVLVDFDPTGPIDAGTSVVGIDAPTAVVENTTGGGGADYFALDIDLNTTLPGVDNTGVIDDGDVVQNLYLDVTIRELVDVAEEPCVAGDEVCELWVVFDDAALPPPFPDLNSNDLVGTWTAAPGTNGAQDPAGTFVLNTEDEAPGTARRSGVCNTPYSTVFPANTNIPTEVAGGTIVITPV